METAPPVRGGRWCSPEEEAWPRLQLNREDVVTDGGGLVEWAGRRISSSVREWPLPEDEGVNSSVPGCGQSPVIGIPAEQRRKEGAQPAGSLGRALPQGGTSGYLACWSEVMNSRSVVT